MSAERYVYGYGSTKHIPSGNFAIGWNGKPGDEIGLCGAAGGNPAGEHELPPRPVCKRCIKKASATP